MMDRLSLGDKLVAAGGIVLLVLSFIAPWWKVSSDLLVDEASITGKAWDYGILMKGSLILALVYAVWILLQAGGVGVPEIPAKTHAGLGGAIVLLFLLQLIIGPPDVTAGLLGGIDIERGLMMFVAIIPVAMIGYGSYLKSQEEGGTAPIGGVEPTSPPPPA